MSTELETRISEWALWYHHHKEHVGRSESLRKMEQFYTMAIDGLLECVAIVARDVRTLERRDKPRYTGLFLPKGYRDSFKSQ